MLYHGEIFDDGERLLIIESEHGYAPIVTVKLDAGSVVMELNIGCDQARELARHLNAAVEAADTSVA